MVRKYFCIYYEIVILFSRSLHVYILVHFSVTQYSKMWNFILFCLPSANCKFSVALSMVVNIMPGIIRLCRLCLLKTSQFTRILLYSILERNQQNVVISCLIWSIHTRTLLWSELMKGFSEKIETVTHCPNNSKCLL